MSICAVQILQPGMKSGLFSALLCSTLTGRLLKPAREELMLRAYCQIADSNITSCTETPHDKQWLMPYLRIEFVLDWLSAYIFVEYLLIPHKPSLSR